MAPTSDAGGLAQVWRADRRTTRRDVLYRSGVVLATASVAGCDLLTTDPENEDDESEEQGLEAPMLAEQVSTSDLPPLQQRLPEPPMVVEPVERAGVYGGTWNTALLGQSEYNFIYQHCHYDNLVRWMTTWTGAAGNSELVSNVAESFDVNDDGTEFTFQLRKGMRWSDGEPFTAHDIVFAMEDVLLNEEIYPSGPPTLISADDEPASVEMIDDYTVVIIFPNPVGLFLHRLATVSGHILTHFPRHYAEQFHPDYNASIDELVEAEGAADWVELFSNKCGPGSNWGENPDLPTLGAWRLVTPFGDEQRVVLERNPYYWKTDPDGRQLPYLDQVVFDVVNDLEVMLLKGTNGEIDLEAPSKPRLTTTANKPVLARNRESGGYRFIDGAASRMNIALIQLNLTYADETKREIFRNKDFRIGLSHAIDRQEIVDVAMQRQGEPYQAGPVPDSPFYHERLATQYLEYDVDLANEYLDNAFPNKDGDGLRIGPDGNPISIVLEFAGGYRPEWIPMLELIKEYWQAVGVEAILRNEDRTLFLERTSANEHEAAVWHGDDGLAVMIAPQYYCPVAGAGQQRYAVAWQNWHLGGTEPMEEPPEPVRAQMELYEQLASTVDPDEQAALMTDILDVAADQFYTIGVARETAKYFVATNNFRNVPDSFLESYAYPTPGPTNPEQYFIDPS